MKVLTRFPVALVSADHVYPRGTKNDNSKNLLFNAKLKGLRHVRSLLDLGCSGGGFVESMVIEGTDAIGLEGSDYSKHLRRAAWGTIPERLFTVDLGKPFLLVNSGDVVEFDVVTAWEFLEHLSESELETLMVSLHAHTATGALLVASVNMTQDTFEGVDYHQTVTDAKWWRRFFDLHGWENRPDLERYLAPDWVRGPNTEGEASECFVWCKR